jgi:sulfite reductase beta subunit-like hemoprotein
MTLKCAPYQSERYIKAKEAHHAAYLEFQKARIRYEQESMGCEEFQRQRKRYIAVQRMYEEEFAAESERLGV